jgi:hypothetical protein
MATEDALIIANTATKRFRQDDRSPETLWLDSALTFTLGFLNIGFLRMALDAYVSA